MRKLLENRGIIRRYAEEWTIGLDENSGDFGGDWVGDFFAARGDVAL